MTATAELQPAEVATIVQWLYDPNSQYQFPDQNKMAVDGQPEEEDTSQSKLTNFCGNASTGGSNEGFEN